MLAQVSLRRLCHKLARRSTSNHWTAPTTSTSCSRGMASDPFEVRGTVTVTDSATVLCVRRRPLRNGDGSSAVVAMLTPDDVGGSGSPFFQATPGDSDGIFGSSGVMRFESGWEVLVEQSEVVNWLRSSPDKLRLMRYGGEWKLPGGNVDDGETPEQCARRELVEELLAPIGIELPPSAVLRPMVTKQTRPIRSRSNLMHCFVALERENPWLRDLDIERVNEGLAERRKRFATIAADADRQPLAKFWALPPAEREAVTPEVREVQWMPLRDAVKHALSSMSKGVFVNDFQREAFEKYGRKRRDPMFITAAILVELEGFSNEDCLVQHCSSVDLASLTRDEQWLFDGMDQAAVDAAFAARRRGTGINPSFKTPEHIARLRHERERSLHQPKL